MERDVFRELFFAAAFDAFVPGVESGAPGARRRGGLTRRRSLPRLSAPSTKGVGAANPCNGSRNLHVRPTGPARPCPSSCRPIAKPPTCRCLFERLATTLDGLPWEMVVVDDDSSDGTYDVAYAIARRDPRLRCLRRVNRLGLAGAVIEGWLASSADFVAVIDGDLQHDETILPQMYAALAQGDGNLAIGTRVADPNAPAGCRRRARSSAISANGSSVWSRASVTDPMSGFFMTRREIVARLAPRLSADGFKILVDVVLSARGRLKIVEVPYVFRPRTGGRIEAVAAGRARFPRPGRPPRDRRPAADALRAVRLDRRVGLVVHLLVLAVLRRGARAQDFTSARSPRRSAAWRAISCSTTRSPIATGAIAASARSAASSCSRCCAASARSPTSTSPRAVPRPRLWWLAGLAGALIGVVWNYAASETFVWRPGASAEEARAASHAARTLSTRSATSSRRRSAR